MDAYEQGKIFTLKINYKKRKILHLNSLICVPFIINSKCYLQAIGDKIPFIPFAPSYGFGGIESVFRYYTRTTRMQCYLPGI